MPCCSINLNILAKLAHAGQVSIPRWDGYFYGWLKPEYLVKRALEGTSWPGGTAAMMIGMMELKNILLTQSCLCLGCTTRCVC